MKSGPWKHPKTGIWWYRKAVPQRLRPCLGKREIKESLHTRDADTARAAWAQKASEVSKRFAQAEKQLAGGHSPTHDDVESLAIRWGKDERERLTSVDALKEIVVVDSVEHKNERNQPQRVTEAFSIWEERIPTPVEDNTSSLLYEALGNITDRLLLDQGWSLDRESEVFRHFLESLAKQALKLGGWAVEKYNALRVENLGEESEKRAPTISECWDLYKEKLKRELPDSQIAESRIDDYRSAVMAFADFSGDKAVTDVTPDDIKRFRDECWKEPKQPKHKIKSLPFYERLREAERLGLPTVSGATIKNKLKHLSALFEAMIDTPDTGLTSNPAREVRPPALSKKKAPPEYQYHELERIFGSDWFSSLSPTKRADYGEAPFWLPIVMYYTGARLNEVAGLDVSDVETVQGVLCFRFREGGEKRLKNVASARDVPVHDDLKSLGLLEYVQSLDSGERLWPKLRQNRDGEFGAGLSKRWADFISKQGLKRREVKPSHGFRHTFITGLRSKGVGEEVIGVLCGHSQTSQTSEYGSYNLEFLKATIQYLDTIPHFERLREVAGKGRR